jgi:hypothetical protein
MTNDGPTLTARAAALLPADVVADLADNIRLVQRMAFVCHEDLGAPSTWSPGLAALDRVCVLRCPASGPAREGVADAMRAAGLALASEVPSRAPDAPPGSAQLLFLRRQDDVAFLIQGPPCGGTDDAAAVCALHGTPVDGTWREDDLEEACRRMREGGFDNGQNKYLHACGTLLGLERLVVPRPHFEYAVKVRGDEYYTRLSAVVDNVRARPGLVTTHNVYFRREWLYHASDHVIGGTVPSLVTMFGAARDALEGVEPYDRGLLHVAEMVLSGTYIRAREGAPLPHDPSLARALMRKHFDIVPISRLGAFRLASNSCLPCPLTRLEELYQPRCPGLIEVESMDEVAT